MNKSAPVSTATNASYEALKEKRAWDFAIAPAKSLPMQAFMLYMSGGGVQIFSMGIVAMLLFSPFTNLAGINAGTSPSMSFNPPKTKPNSRIVNFGHSVRAVRTRGPCIVAFIKSRRELPDDAVAAKTGLSRMQPPHARPWTLEVPLDGPAPYGNWRLASIRESRRAA